MTSGILLPSRIFRNCNNCRTLPKQETHWRELWFWGKLCHRWRVVFYCQRCGFHGWKILLDHTFLPWSETVDTGIFRVPLTQGYGGRRQEGVGNGSQGKRSFVHIHSKVTATTLVIYVHRRKTDQIYYGRWEIPKSLHRENGPM